MIRVVDIEIHVLEKLDIMLINFTVSSRLQDALGPAKLEISSVLTYFIIQPERLQRRVVAPMYSYKQ